MPPASPSPQPQFVFAKTAHRYTQHHGSHEPPLVQEGPRPRRPTGATSDNAGPGRTARWRRRRGIAGHLPDDLDGQRCRANRRSRHRSRRQTQRVDLIDGGMPPTLRTGHPPIESGDPAPASSSETPQRPQITDSHARLHHTAGGFSRRRDKRSAADRGPAEGWETTVATSVATDFLSQTKRHFLVENVRQVVLK
jgi:hypothetical protein